MPRTAVSPRKTDSKKPAPPPIFGRGRAPRTEPDNMSTRGRPTTPVVDVDTDWFKQTIRAKGLTQRQLAAALGKDAGNLTRVLRGERQISLNDAVTLSTFLGTEIGEVARRLGYEYHGARSVIAGAIKADGAVTSICPRTGQTVPAAVLARVKVYMCEAPTGTLSTFNGAAFHVLDTAGGNPFPPDAFGRLAVVEAAGEVVPLLGTLDKSGARGAVDLVSLDGTRRRMSQIYRASIVAAIICA